jgi:hypothetical protein
MPDEQRDQVAADSRFNGDVATVSAAGGLQCVRSNPKANPGPSGFRQS